MSGKVILVGAGPGGAGLMTVRGREALLSAEVVVYDRLVDEEILRMIPERAERINVGKNVGDHPVPQHKINEILLEKAQTGKRVVRLKGGDCFVFGRGGEELELLAERGVDFEVVPGITSALAVPAYAGIPVTHRDYCASVHIITGHRKKNEALALDYEALVRLDGTLVFLMALSTFGDIAQGLMKAGLPESFPCAVIENGARSEQRKWLTTVGGAEGCIEENEVQSPAIFVVGRVCALSERLDWYDVLPLKGRRVAIVPPRKDADGLAALLSARGARVTLLPAPETQWLDAALPQSGETLLLPSSTAVDALFHLLDAHGRDARALHGVHLVCVGVKAAAVLRGHGIAADAVLSRGGTLHLNESQGGLRILCAEEEVSDFAGKHAGAICCAAWREVLPERVDMDWHSQDCIALTTLSGVRALEHLAKGAELSGIRAVCIGEKVTQAARGLGLDAVCAREATLEAAAEEIGRLCGME